MIYLNNVNNKKAPHNEELIFFSGVPKRIRTSGLSLRRGTLYPAEL